ncbi:ribonuclease Z [Arachidicoccus ginsenosidimutans]|uniref:ribonuclease Z n=1 Tax=Arachidicoccus sp. BS20 TaxID=1850526 RepID=UPI0007F08BDA|nr:ribonuclease Z [Arachidicoccus sp. BS20]ANI89556.1 ribonuclease Z [Arachidicoccus sp. BS20]
MFGITILGNNSALPAHGRHPTSQIITIADQLLMLDCGEGTQFRIRDFRVKRSKINHIFISHLHGDHYFGLIGLLSSMSLLGRTQDLHLFSPAPLQQIIAQQTANNKLSFQINFHPLEGNELILEEEKFTVSSFRVIHKIECFGFLIKEKHKPRKVNADAALQAGIPPEDFEELQLGEDYVLPNGSIISNESVTFTGKENKSYAYCADTLYTETFLPFIKNANLIYHESTYLNDLTEQAKERFHSTAAQAATIALKANAKRLLLGHFSSKYKELDEFETQAKEIFPNTEISCEGVTYIV